jgi:hypothetical protein
MQDFGLSRFARPPICTSVTIPERAYLIAISIALGAQQSIAIVAT